MPTGWMRWVAVGSAAVVLSACGTSSDSAQLVDSGQSPGAEVTGVEEPRAEATGPEAGGQAKNAGIAVQLPGVAGDGVSVVLSMGIGGGCARVGLEALETDGAAVTIDRLQATAGVAIMDGGCGDLPPCLSGVGLTAAQDTCSVRLGLGTITLAADAQLEVTGATVRCPDLASCEQAVDEVRGDGAIDLRLRGTVRSGDPEPEDDAGDEDGDGDGDLVEPFDEGSTGPGDGDVTEPQDEDGGSGTSDEPSPEQ